MHTLSFGLVWAESLGAVNVGLTDPVFSATETRRRAPSRLLTEPFLLQLLLVKPNNYNASRSS